MAKIIDKMDLISTEKLIPYSNNPKQHPIEQIEKIANSIEQYGFTQPIVISEDNEIIIGHGRVEAAEELGLNKVPAIRRDDLAEDEIRALRIADNKVAESAWDIEALALELDEIDFEELEIGFELDEIEEIYAELGGGQEVFEDDFDGGADKDEPAITERGDVIELGRHRLVCGDSTEEDDFSKIMNGDKADMVFTDPPYGIGYEYNMYDDSSNEKNARLIEDVFRLVDCGKVWTCGLMNLKRDINRFGDTKVLVWNKKFSAAGNGLGGASTWEPILVLKPQKKGLKNDVLTYKTDREKIDGKSLREKHPCPKPIALFYELIKSLSFSRSTIYDPFGGSGSTLIAAEQLDRICYMMEIDPHYCDVIVRRYIEYKLKRAEEVNIKVNGKEVDYDDYL